MNPALKMIEIEIGTFLKEKKVILPLYAKN